MEQSRVLSSVLRQLVSLVRRFKRPGGLIFGLLRLLVCLVRVFLRLLRVLVGLVGLVLRLLRALVGLVGLDLRLLRLLRGLGCLVLGLLRLLIGLVGLVLRLPRSVVRLLCTAPRLLCLLARTLRLVQSHLNPVTNPIHVLADVLPGRQLSQHASVLLPPALLLIVASRLFCGLYILRR